MKHRHDGIEPGADDRRWPRWMEPLRPDGFTRRRLHRQVMASARSLLSERRSWQDVTAGWSSFLAPVAAGLTILFGALAYRAVRPASDGAADRVAAPLLTVSERDPIGFYLAPDAETPPQLLIDASEPSMESVLAAALVSR